MQSTVPAARAVEVWKVYGTGAAEVAALRGVSVSLARGRFTAITGRRPDREWFDTVIDAVGLRDRLKHRPARMSGGQQQRVACARALLARPEIVFADEPTGNLDSHAGAEVLGFLRRSVTAFGQTVVMVTHDPSAAAYADRVVFLADGQVVTALAEPTADAILDTMKDLEATYRAKVA